MGAGLQRTVVLVGMMGAGKTAVGRELARRLAVPFTDSDAEIEAAANQTITEIFARDGEPFFRRKEAQVIARLLEGRPGVLSVGGGAFLVPQTRQLIAARGVSVWLKVPLDLLWARVRRKTTRPLLQTRNPRATLARMLAERAPVYAQADLTIEAQAEHSIETTAERVHAALAAWPGLLTEPPEGTKGSGWHD
ncbi:MAG: shikimate kinase [Pararhodobacter sp.]|nr:shikimate kinase [Pararhodobacter sp.]